MQNHCCFCKNLEISKKKMEKSDFIGNWAIPSRFLTIFYTWPNGIEYWTKRPIWFWKLIARNESYSFWTYQKNDTYKQQFKQNKMHFWNNSYKFCESFEICVIWFLRAQKLFALTKHMNEQKWPSLSTDDCSGTFLLVWM